MRKTHSSGAVSRFRIVHILNLHVAPHPPAPLNTEHVKSWLLFHQREQDRILTMEKLFQKGKCQSVGVSAPQMYLSLLSLSNLLCKIDLQIFGLHTQEKKTRAQKMMHTLVFMREHILSGIFMETSF